MVAYRSEVSFDILLPEDCPSGIPGGVHFQDVGLSWLGVCQDWGGGYSIDEHLYCQSVSIGPFKWYSLLQEFCEWFGNVGKASDKGSLVPKDP